jgi:hypothetical protein
MRYTVDQDTFAINIFNDGEDVPFHYQPDYPNGDPFDSVEEASIWAEAAIAAHSPDVLVYAPNGKGLTGESKPDPMLKANLIAKLGLTQEEAALLRLI